MQRMMAAFAKMDTLSFSGDVLAFQSQFLSAKRELDNTRATMAEYTICKLMRAFDGKSKTIQFKNSKISLRMVLSPRRRKPMSAIPV